MADTFGADIAAWASESQQWASEECATTVRKLYKRVVELSPRVGLGRYSTGHFVNNWRLGEIPQQGEIAGEKTYIQKALEIESFIDDEYFLNHPSGKVTMTNSTSYVTEIEYEGWKKTLGPNARDKYAPVATAIAEIMP